jgi:hypothetical protein
MYATTGIEERETMAGLYLTPVRNLEENAPF